MYELEESGSGVWVAVQNGRTWCSAKGPKLLDLSKVCVAAVLPKRMRTIEYCSGGRGCTHALPVGFQVFHSKLPMAPESMSIAAPTPGKGRGKGAKREKGAKGGRGGKGGRGKGARKRARDDDDESRIEEIDAGDD